MTRCQKICIWGVVVLLVGRSIGPLEALAYARHESDLQTGTARGLTFDNDAAIRAVSFYSDYLKFGKGEWVGNPFILEPWQEFIIASLYGWKRADGTRRFRHAYIEVPRKNGKTELGAGVALYQETFDNEGAPEVYAVATKREQARLVWNAAKSMVRQSRVLKDALRIYHSAISCDANNGTFQPLSSDSNTLDGLNISAAIVDELHAHKNRELWDVIISACGARRQPLIFSITTAGVGNSGICWEQRQDAEKILNGVFEDDSKFAFIACAEHEDDWTDEDIWKKANPNYGVSVKPEFIADECRRAQRTPAAINAFKRYYLNQWVNAAQSWLDIQKWKACAAPFDPEALDGRRCYGGLDLSRTTDLTAFALLFPPDAGRDDPYWRALCQFWVPAEKIVERSRQDNVPYLAWVKDGWLHSTPGDVVDYAPVAEAVKSAATRYELVEVGFDPYNATKFYTDMIESGFEKLVEVRQGMITLSPAMKELERIILSANIRHVGNPVLDWCVSNVAPKEDHNGNIMPDKKRSKERIDGVSAMCTAMARAIQGVQAASVYEARGVLIL